MIKHVRFIAFSFPSPGYIDNCSRCFYLHQSFKCFTQNSTLLNYVTGLTHRVSEGPLEEDRPGRFDFLSVLPDNGNTNSGYTGYFYSPLDQSHGLIADGSTRCQQHIVYFLLLQSGSYLRGIHFHECINVWTHYVTHE